MEAPTAAYAAYGTRPNFIRARTVCGGFSRHKQCPKKFIFLSLLLERLWLSNRVLKLMCRRQGKSSGRWVERPDGRDHLHVARKVIVTQEHVLEQSAFGGGGDSQDISLQVLEPCLLLSIS